MQTAKPLLLVDDDCLDAAITRRSLRQLKIPNPLIHRSNGEDALAYLNTSLHDVPCVILLDLNMPRMNGFEFLSHIKTDAHLKDIPVVVLTTSIAQEDVQASLRLGAAEYIVKAMDIGTFLESLRVVKRYCACENSACDGPRTHRASNP
jgi:CheY-like chemotaxis protein